MRRVFRRFALRSLLFGLVPIALFAAGPAAALTVAQITSIPASSQSWGNTTSGATIQADVFWIRNSVTVSGGTTLTLDPGIIIKFDPGTYMQVNGQLQANGTGVSPILITSSRDDTEGGDTNGDGGATQAAPSDWNAIYIAGSSPADSTRLKFCDIAYGGYGNNGMITFQSGGGGDIMNCTLRRSYFGVAISGTSAPNIVDTNIQNSTQTPIFMDFNSTPTLNRVTFSQGNNGYDAIGLRSTTLNSGTATLTKRAVTVGATPYSNVTYVTYGGVTVNNGATLVIAPGVVIKMIGSSAITNYGTLTMNGTPSDTVSITSINDDTIGQPTDTNDNGSTTSPHGGDWGNVSYQVGSTGSLQYCQLRFGTASLNTGMLEAFNVNLSVSNTLLTDAGHGFTFHGTSAPTLSNVVINNMASAPTLMSLTCNPSFSNVSLHANGITALGLIGEPVSGALHLTQRNLPPYSNITYYIENGYLDVAAGSSLTIDPGIVIKFQFSGNAGIIADGTLNASGTVSAPIVFTAERDNVWGNPADTNGDGGGTSPAVGQWGYVELTSTSTGSVLNYCRFEYGSAAPFDGYPCTLWINNVSPTVSNCNVHHGNYGIRINGAVTPTIGAADTVTNCAYAPILMSAMSDPTFTTPYFLNNGQNGLALISETLTQSATLKYRPQVFFPAASPYSPAVYAYICTGTITVPTGFTLAIQPQVVIKVQFGPAFAISGTLNAVGNPGGSNRITVTSYKDDTIGGDTNGDGNTSSPVSGNWNTAFQFNPTATAACIVRNCLFTFGGSGNPGGPAVIATGTSPRIVSSDFLFNNSALTFGAGSKSVVDSCSILNCNNLPVSMSLLADPTFLHLTWSGNPYSVIGLLGETVGQNVRLATRTLGTGPLANVAYAPTGTITIGNAATWTINPGITIKLGRYFYDPTGVQISVDGAISAVGKPDSLIVFTSMADDAFNGDSNGDGALTHGNAGDWLGISFSSLTNVAATSFNNVRFRFAGGSGYPALSMTNAGIPISNTNFTACYDGIDIYGTSAPTITNVNVDSCAYMPVRMSLASNPTFTNVNFKYNNYTGIGVVTETIAQDLLWKIRPISGRNNMPYLVDGPLAAGLATTMTLQPGLIVKFIGGASLTINRALFALGKAVPESLIVFTSSRDDFYGGRSDTTSATHSPNAQDWNWVLVQNTAIDGQVHFKDCVFRYGGSGFSGALRANSSNPAVDSCQIAYNATGISVEGSANPHIQGCSFFGHVYDAVYNAGSSHCVFAENCWWGANNGPLDANAAADVCGAGATNAGSGDAVTNNVDYANFATTGLISPLLGDVSLNGRVLAYDASLIFQYLVAATTLNNLQLTLADVTGNGTVTGGDGSAILQWVAGLIPAFPGNYNRAGHVHPDALVSGRNVAEPGTFHLSLGDPEPIGGEWHVPVMADGSVPIYAAELRLTGPGASALTGFDAAGGSIMAAENVKDGMGLVALGSAEPLAPGVIGTLRFTAGADWRAPTLAWGRVNETELTAPGKPAPAVPSFSSLESPRPNPARQSVAFQLGIAAGEAGKPASVEILDVSGRRIRSLSSGGMAAGLHPLVWDLTDQRGAPVRAGVYLVRAHVGGFDAVRRIAVVR